MTLFLFFFLYDWCFILFGVVCARVFTRFVFFFLSCCYTAVSIGLLFGCVFSSFRFNNAHSVFMVWFALYVSFFPHSHILRCWRCNLKTERIYFNININKQTASIINLKITLSGHKSICRYLSVPFLFSLCLYLSLVSSLDFFPLTLLFH